MSGILSRFISGAAGAGADILASQIKGDAEEASAIRRALTFCTVPRKRVGRPSASKSSRPVPCTQTT